MQPKIQRFLYITLQNHANANMHKRKAIHVLQRSFATNSRNEPHTKLKNSRLLEGRKKGPTPSAKEHKTHKLPLNTCTRDKEHTKLTLSTHDRAKSRLSTHAPPKHMH
jgi:hypothetical protein